MQDKRGKVLKSPQNGLWGSHGAPLAASELIVIAPCTAHLSPKIARRRKLPCTKGLEPLLLPLL